jgi:transcriptional regulator of acetoin/glycerol metabolism
MRIADTVCRTVATKATRTANSNAATYADFGLSSSQVAQPAPSAAPFAFDGVRLGNLERDAVNTALQQAKGNISHAAKSLGISRAALYRKIEKHGL